MRINAHKSSIHFCFCLLGITALFWGAQDSAFAERAKKKSSAQSTYARIGGNKLNKVVAKTLDRTRYGRTVASIHKHLKLRAKVRPPSSNLAAGSKYGIPGRVLKTTLWTTATVGAIGFLGTKLLVAIDGPMLWQYTKMWLAGGAALGGASSLGNNLIAAPLAHLSQFGESISFNRYHLGELKLEVEQQLSAKEHQAQKIENQAADLKKRREQISSAMYGREN